LKFLGKKGHSNLSWGQNAEKATDKSPKRGRGKEILLRKMRKERRMGPRTKKRCQFTHQIIAGGHATARKRNAKAWE